MAETITVDPGFLQRPPIQRLLGRSALYEALALALAYPDDDTVARVEALAEDLRGHPVVVGRRLDDALDRLCSALRDVDAGRLAPVHFVLFEGSVLCSPHETEYIRDPLAKAAQLADIAGFYGAFGLKVSRRHQTTPDEICTELEFMALLTRKEAYAAIREWSEHQAVARDAGRRFLESHLGRWSGAFAAALCDHADEAAGTRDDPAAARWFHAVGDLLRAVVQAEMDEMGVHPSLLTARYQDLDEGSLVCPMTGETSPEEDLPLGGALGVIRATE
ncbi:MAG: molecular chaperone TorD family protein [Dehalococcoidia bacterium]|nr:molecular chaperone TorD family protein [Dehalococcoidia bacterium]